MPYSDWVEACPRASESLERLLRVCAPCCSACALTQAERLKILLNGC